MLQEFWGVWDVMALKGKYTNNAFMFYIVAKNPFHIIGILFYHLYLCVCTQDTSILEEYNINWTQKLGAGISGPVRYFILFIFF